MKAKEKIQVNTMRRATRGDVWSIVLAGGEGERLRPLVIRWLGRHRPKQYCAFVGSRSMFQHTVDRVTKLTPPVQSVIVAAHHHRSEVQSQLRGRAIAKVLLQPNNRDTAAGIFLPLSYVRARDPTATVVIHPSDHFVYPEHRFLVAVRHAISLAETMPDRMLLLGVQPDRLETEYGWIRRGARINGSPTHPVHAVSSFLEKPTAAEADDALRDGALWNTLVVAAKVDCLWRAGRVCFPEMIPLFERLGPAWDTPDEPAALATTYRTMPVFNFSSHLLQRMPGSVAVLELTDVLWSDWGNPSRIAEMIRRLGKTPTFPWHCLDRPFVPHDSAARTARHAKFAVTSCDSDP